MPLLQEVIVAAVLVTLTLSLQSTGTAAFALWLRAYFANNTSRLGLLRCADLMIRVTHVLLAIQVLEVVLWAGFYRWKCLPSWDSALYFSATSYSTVGYGDVLLPGGWRLLGPIESVTGVLMCGLSASGLFTVVARLVRHEEPFLPSLPPLSNPADAQPSALKAA